MTIPSAAALKLVLGIACALAIALLAHERSRWKATAVLRQQQLLAEQAAHSSSIANHRAAAERARASDLANALRVKAEQAAINERTVDEYESRIAAARARARQLQRDQGTAAAGPGAVGATPMPGLPAAAQGVAQSPGQARLPANDALIATEQAIQLDALISWVRRQAAVPVNGDRPPAPAAAAGEASGGE